MLPEPPASRSVQLQDPRGYKGLPCRLTDDRNRAALGDDCATWRPTAENPHNEIMRRPEDLVLFKQRLRQLFDRIKELHEEDATINVFPILPNPATVEVGRVRMSKADLPLLIYDQIRSAGRFVPTLTISC